MSVHRGVEDVTNDDTYVIQIQITWWLDLVSIQSNPSLMDADTVNELVLTQDSIKESRWFTVIKDQ